MGRHVDEREKEKWRSPPCAHAWRQVVHLEGAGACFPGLDVIQRFYLKSYGGPMNGVSFSNMQICQKFKWNNANDSLLVSNTSMTTDL